MYFHKNCIRSRNIATKKEVINGPMNDLNKNKCNRFNMYFFEVL